MAQPRTARDIVEDLHATEPVFHRTPGRAPVKEVSAMEILRYAAFSIDPTGGNPAGVVLDAGALDDVAMQRIAADVGYSETAFLTATGPHTARVQYFAPIVERPRDHRLRGGSRRTRP